MGASAPTTIHVASSLARAGAGVTGRAGLRAATRGRWDGAATGDLAGGVV